MASGEAANHDARYDSSNPTLNNCLTYGICDRDCNTASLFLNSITMGSVDLVLCE